MTTLAEYRRASSVLTVKGRTTIEVCVERSLDAKVEERLVSTWIVRVQDIFHRHIPAPVPPSAWPVEDERTNSLRGVVPDVLEQFWEFRRQPVPESLSIPARPFL